MIDFALETKRVVLGNEGAPTLVAFQLDLHWSEYGQRFEIVAPDNVTCPEVE